MNKIFDFSIAFDETPMGTRVMVEYNSGKYRTETIQNFMHSLFHHIRVPHQTLLKVRSLLRDYPAPVFSKYLASFRCTGTEIAMRRRNAFLTYEALQDQATNIADWVDDSWIKYTGCCIRSDDIITVNAASNDAIVAIIAVLRVGAAYAPIDPGWPQLRRTQVAENIGFSLHIPKSMLSSISNKRVKRKRPYFNRISEGDLIYVLQTSGTTGSPKGVALSHKNVSCFLQSANSQTLMRPGHRISHSVNVVFDVSVMNIIGELKKYKCSFAFLTSAMFNALTKTELHQIAELEKLFVGGEALYDKNLLEATKFGLDITQIYGPTETTIWSLTNRCKTLAQESSLIGLPMSNETCWIKHHTFEGELIIGGAKVARGYLNSHANNKFCVIDGVPCYCTGDNVRIQREGFIYRGRIDGEMKVRGHRVESEEVAKTILTYAPQISQVSVAVSNNTLLAFVVHKGILNESKITLRLKNILPSFMVPSRFISVSYLPLSTSGKVDMDMLLKEHARRLSPVPARHSIIREMMSLTELKVASIFENLLNVQNVASEDNFFSLGGHSLLLFELKSKLLQSFDVDIEVHELLNNLTVGGLAELLTKKLKENLYKADTSIITEIHETANANFNIYFIHAIGGSIFPYYAFLKVFPKEVNLYAIEYKLHFNASTLKELAAFYASTVNF
uniref:Carrier domain-containing protein n=1 Tax=Angiostrongylus cantonensis TaxID=6313 RepID=A0A0K0D710_ANGCA